jgi:hypothetical protein
MRENDEFIGHVEDYLVEFDGATPLPGRVLDAIHAQLPRTRQAKAGPGFMRMPPMLSTISSRAPLGIAAAAVVVAVALGAVFMNRGNQAALGGPVASPTPRPSQSAGPGRGSDVRTLQNANQTSCPGITGRPLCLEPGTYLLGGSAIWPAAVTFEVPENWWWYAGGTGQSGILVQTEDVENGSGWGLTFETVGPVSIDPCDPAAGTWTTKDTPGELAEAIGTWQGFELSEPEPIRNGAYNGVKFTVTTSLTSEDCPAPLMWQTKGSHAVDAYPMLNAASIGPRTAEFHVFNVDPSGGSRSGELIVIRVMGFPETSPHEEDSGIAHDADAHVVHQPALQSILDSIQISPFPEQ